jgi:site-specific recombinase XerD
MFSDWFSGDECGQYRTSPHKQRMDQVGSSLLELRYANDVIRQHLHEWLRFSRHLEECGLPLPAAGADTVRQYVDRRTAKTSEPLTSSSGLCQNLPRNGRTRTVSPARWRSSSYASLVCPYPEDAVLLFVQTHRGLAAKTARKYTQKLSAFAQHLGAAGITELDRITPGYVREFYENANNSAPRRSYGSTLRVFFRWAAAQGWLSSSLGDAVPRPRQYRYVNLPDVLGQAEVDRVLATVDRSTPLGRRDYAVLMLAARYGMRPCDIRELTLDEIEWREARIDLRQVKTGRPLVLPLLPDVADALSAYLIDGRPTSTNRAIFLRHRAPFAPFAAENNLATIMRDALRRSGLGDRPGRRGLYLFRHTLATQLLAAGHPLKAIADVLGHASTQTTYGYTRVELAGLRSVAISAEEVIR